MTSAKASSCLPFTMVGFFGASSELALSVFFSPGKLRTMKAHYLNAAGDIRIIRPFIYVRERQTREFAENSKLPIITENCPACFEGPKERYRVKTLIAQQEHLFPNLLNNLLRTMKPLLVDASFNTILEQIRAREQDAPATSTRRMAKDDGASDAALLSAAAPVSGHSSLQGARGDDV
eukprot:m.522169 g.522169  ORF g.522169 m.522169 type:complete len:178 (+) comp57513_c0_seq2:2809-3342(+)